MVAPWKRKTVTILALFVAVVLLGRLFLLYWFAGFILSRIVSSKRPGAKGRFKSVVIPLYRWRLHIHHWLYSVCLLAIVTTFNIHFISPMIVYGILGGFIFQGIYFYNDWHIIIRSKG